VSSLFIGSPEGPGAERDLKGLRLKADAMMSLSVERGTGNGWDCARSEGGRKRELEGVRPACPIR
jgi:hypothetical protein